MIAGKGNDVDAQIVPQRKAKWAGFERSHRLLLR